MDCMYFACTTLLVLSLAGTAAGAGGLEQQIADQYRHHVVSARAPIGEQGQDFSADGKPLEPPRSPWIIHPSLLYVDALHLDGTVLEVKAEPVASFSNPQVAVLGPPVKIRIHLDQQPGSLEQAEQIVQRVFITDEKEVRQARTVYRRADALDEPSYPLGSSGLKPPQGQFTPDPEMSDEARKAKYQGTVVLGVIIDSRGLVSRMWVLRALGMRLDANAMTAIRKWRFQPATLQGRPVAVELNLQTEFRLY